MFYIHENVYELFVIHSHYIFTASFILHTQLSHNVIKMIFFWSSLNPCSSFSTFPMSKRNTFRLHQVEKIAHCWPLFFSCYLTFSIFQQCLFASSDSHVGITCTWAKGVASNAYSLRNFGRPSGSFEHLHLQVMASQHKLTYDHLPSHLIRPLYCRLYISLFRFSNDTEEISRAHNL